MNGTAVDPVEQDIPPSRLTGDYVELVYLCLLIVLGTPINLVVFLRLLPETQKKNAGGSKQRNTFAIFKFHLCITDFAILLVHALVKAVWLGTYRWPFLAAGCKLYKFLSAFTYYSNSNVIVCIGLDRLKTVYSKKRRGGASADRRVKVLLTFAWTFAALCSLPQLIAWDTVAVTEDWHQCVTVWDIAAHEGYLNDKLLRLELAYELAHLALVFWAPFAILLVSYLLIAARLLQFSFRPLGGRPNDKYSLASITRLPMPLETNGSLTLSDSSEPPPQVMVPRIRQRSITEGNLTSKSKERNAVELIPRTQSYASSTHRPRVAPMSARLPIWRRQMRSKVFVTTLAVVSVHVGLWLPYNMLNAIKFIDIAAFDWMAERGGKVLEDLIVLNSLINPILYGWRR
uniref:G-protein coupled receptors family 1 profile domain-containing protein n=1 Tax=Plectus sambesii TaxID=2011161 RepID=A0A914UJT5_9BILA